MIEYILNGKLISVKPEHVQQFLQENPQASLASGNQGDSNQSANVGSQTSAQNPQQENTELKSEDGSLESQALKLQELREDIDTNSYDIRIKQLESSLDKYKSTKDTDNYNKTASDYNSLIEEYKEKASNYNEVLESYQKEYKRVNFNKEQDEARFYEERRQKGLDIIDKSNTPNALLPDFLVSWSMALSDNVLGMIEGVGTAFASEGIAEGLLKGKSKEQIINESASKEGDINKNIANALGAINVTQEVLHKYARKEFDKETGKELQPVDLLNPSSENFDIIAGGNLAAEQAVSSLMSLVISAAAPIPGALALGVSSYGQEFDAGTDRFKQGEITKEDLKTIRSASALKAGAEFAGEYFGGKAFRLASGMVKSGAKKEVVKEFNRTFIEKGLRGFGEGFAGEFLAEGGTSILQDLTDKAMYGDEKGFTDVFKNFINNGLIGGLLGGPSAGMARSASKVERTDIIRMLAPKKWQLQTYKLKEQLLKAKNNLKNANPKTKALFQQRVDLIQKKIDQQNKLLDSVFDNKTNTELENYAAVLDEISAQRDIAFDSSLDSDTRDAAKQRVLELNLELNNQTDGFVNTKVEEAIARQIKTFELIQKRKGTRGFGKGVKIKYLKNAEEAAKFGIDKDAGGGFVESENTIYINEEVAGAQGSSNILGHELLHAVMSRNFKTDNASMKPLVDSFKKYLVDSGNEAILNRIEARMKGNGYFDADGNIKEGNLEEYFNMFSDLVDSNEIPIVEDSANSLGKSISNTLSGLGFKSVKLESGKDVFDFIKTYNKNVNRSGLLGELTKRAAARVKVKSSKVDKADPKVLSQDMKKSADVKPEVDELGSMGWTKETWKSQGADLAIAEMQANKMLDGLIAAKMKGGLRDGSNEVKKDFISKVYAELTSHVKNFDPESNDSLFGWVNSQISNKAGNVYNREYKDKSLERAVDIDATTSEGAPLVQIEADTDILMEAVDEIGLDETEVEERSRLRRDIRLDEKMMQTVRDAVIKTFGTKLPNVDSKKFRTALEKAFRTELKKPLQDLMGGRSDYDLFLRNHAKAIIKAFPVETLVQMERNLKPEQRIFTESRRITKPTEVDKLISEGKLPKDTNRTSGPQLHTKKSFPGIDKVMAYFRGKDMETILGYKVGASTLGTRKDKLAMELGVELAFDATAETIQNPEVAEKRQMILELQGIEQLDNELAVIGKQIDRDPSVKFSKNALGIDRSKIGDFKSNFPDLLNKIKSDEALATDLPSLRKVVKEVYSDILDTKEIAAVAKKIAGYTSSFLDQKKKTKGLMDVDVSLSEFVLEATEKDVIDKSVLKFLSSLLPSGYNTAASYFNDKARVKKARATFASFVTHLRDELKLPENKILRILHTQYKGMYASSSKIGDGRFNVELIDGVYELVDKGSEAGSTHRGQVFENVDDFYRLAGIKNYKAKLKEIDTKTFAEKSKAAVKDKDYKGRLKQANEAREAVQMIMQYYIDGIKNSDSALDYGDLLMLTKMLGSNMNSPMKRAANLAYIAEGVESMDPDSMGKLTEYEHMVPTSVKILEMVAAYVNNGKLPDGFWDNYEVAVIPKSMDKVLIKNGLRDFLPVMFKKGDENWRRYYNKQTLGENNMVPLVSIKTGEVGRIIGADFVKASNLLVGGDINNKGAQLIGRTSIKYSKSKGMSTFDFDETLIIDGENFITATDPVTGKELKLSSGEWPIKGPGLATDGFEFDFSDFVNVRGGTDGPLLQKMKNQVKKYGNKNVFVLTARMQDAAGPIHGWLKSKGVDIPFKNITGLGDGRGEAKAEWMLDKFAEGYNDMYFVDDAMPNVDAVKKVLDQLDIKSKVVQAKIKFSKDASKDFNDMLERSKGVASDEVVSAARAKIRGKQIRGTFFVPPSAEDFKGLIYSFLGKGKQGDQDLKWFKENLFDPFSKGTREMDSVKQKMTEEYNAMKKAFPDTIKGLSKKIAGTDFTLDNAIRVYLWKEAGIEVPGLSDKEVNLLWSAVKADPKSEAFAQSLSAMSRQSDGYLSPNAHWTAETIASDLANIVNKVNRADYLAEWIENKDLVFSSDNLNKIEAIYGTNFREALEDMLHAMETGSNRPTGKDKDVNRFLNWINGSVGAVMFFNTRSAVLQTLSTVNFLNFEDNNIFSAAKAFANQKQFWSDFSMIFNSDMLKQRRAGLKIDVSANELTEAFSKGKSKTEAVIAHLLQLGFTPTQLADSFAIAMGGSTFYRNRVKKYLKEGKSQKDAESQAFLDFQEIAEETQQSSRPDLISKQQRGVLGRIILAWANTPMQMTRLTKKALSDLVNRRGDTKANISRIIYYGVAQNIIFGTLQTGLAFLAFGSEEEEEKTDAKQLRMVNGVFDTLLRGTGVWGAAASTLKNVIMQLHEELGKGYGKKDWSRVSQKIFDLSPPLGTKHRKIMNAIKTYDYNKDVIKKMDHGINNPGWNVFTNVIEGLTNAPIARVLNKAQNLKLAMQANIETWQRVAIGLGWSAWSVGVEDQEIKEAKAEVKQDRKAESNKRAKEKKAEKKAKQDKENKAKGIKSVRCSGTKSDGARCKITVQTKSKTAKCTYHKAFKDGSDTDGDGKKEYRCRAKTSSGKQCKNKTENKNKKCYAHQ